MKKITFIFFTFSGIYSGFAQNPSKAADTSTSTPKMQVTSQPGKVDMIIVKEKPVVLLFPNPAKNKVELGIGGFEPGYLQISLLNNNGKTVKQEKRLLLYGSESVVLMFSQDPGLYYLLLRQGTKSVRTKLVIQ